MSFQIFEDQENVPRGAGAARPKILQKQAGTSKLAEVTNVSLRNQPERLAKKKTLGLQPQPQPKQKNAGPSFATKNSLSSDVWKPNNNGWKVQGSQPTFTIFDENTFVRKDSKPTAAVNPETKGTKTKGLSENIPAAFSFQSTSTTTIEVAQEAFECSPMVLDISVTEKPAKTLSEKLLAIESMVPESYIPGIYEYLKNLEMECRPKPHYMRKQQDITPQMRAILVDWLVEVAEEYKLHNETLFLAVSFIDRFLSKMSVLRGKLQLVGTAAMFIASKYEEIYPPDVGEFVYLTDDTYTKKQVLRMEQLILTVIAFRLGAPTASYFLQHFARLSNTDFYNTTQHLAAFLCELSLMEVEPFVKYLPSEIAASSLALARLTSGQEVWPFHLQESTSYCLEDLLPCMKHLHAAWQQAPQQPQQAIVTKYKSEKWNSVSTLPPPPLTTLDLAQL